MAQLSPTKYEYQPLLEPDSIRVLQLHPSSDLTASPQCDLIGMRLCDSHQPERAYTAISYVWGDERDSHTISIGSSELTVGKNIHSALRHIRRRDRPIRLWVDAICINQSELTERSHQVQQMCAIYSAAKETTIYLGDQDGGNTGKSAWNFLERNSEWSVNGDGDEDHSIPAKMEQLLEFRGDLDDVEIDVLGRPWFRRVWVFQEVVVSRFVTIQCGNRKIAWDDFCQILLLSPRYHDRYGFSIGRSGKIDVVRDMFHARFSYQEAHGMGDLGPSWHSKVENYKGGDSSILNTLSRTRQLEAFDPRDKIYALLGVSTGIHLNSDLIAVDYHKLCSEVYRDFARHVMETDRNYDILSYIDDFSTGKPHISQCSKCRRHFEGLRDTDSCSSSASSDSSDALDSPDSPQSSCSVGTNPWDDRTRDFVLERNFVPLKKEATGYLPSWVPNWDRSAWNTPSPWKFRYTSRTILSTLEPENHFHSEVRKASVSRSRMWASQQTLAAVGVIIGEVVEYGASIALLGNDELRFQDIRDRWCEDQSRLTEAILEQWQHVLNQGELTLQEGNSLERPYPNSLPILARLLNRQADPPRDSVEYHLLARGRKSIAWNDDNNKAVAVVRDKTSIIETKRVAAYQRFNERSEVVSEGLALLPSRKLNTRYAGKYLIVYLRGSRVPFLVRQTGSSAHLNDKRQVREGLSSALQVEHCAIFGECLVNGFDEIVKDCEEALEESKPSGENDSGEMPPAWTPFSHARVFLIS